MRVAPAALLACLMMAACGPRKATTTMDLLASGDAAACSAADVESQLRTAISPDTAVVKQQAREDGYPLRATDVDALAQGLTYRLDRIALFGAEPARHLARCSAEVAVTSTQYGVASDQPTPIRYTVAVSPADPQAIVVTLASRTARDATQAVTIKT